MLQITAGASVMRVNCMQQLMIHVKKKNDKQTEEIIKNKNEYGNNYSKGRRSEAIKTRITNSLGFDSTLISPISLKLLFQKGS